MTLIVGAPVGDDRAWVLPAYFEALSRQTVRPDALVFVLSRGTPRTVKDGLLDGAKLLGVPSATAIVERRFYSRAERNDDPQDPCRARHFSALRNRLLGLALQHQTDLFLSLDTDVLLDDPATIERLAGAIADGYDLAAPVLDLHERLPCPNAGWWAAGDERSPTRAWRRAEGYDRLRPSPVDVDFAFAAVMMRRHVAAMCRYAPHEAGEDLGFGDSLSRHGFRTAWLTDLPARHVWSPADLREGATEWTSSVR